MSRLLFGLVARLYVALSAGLLAGITLVYLVADFGDRLNLFLDKPLSAVAELYWHKAMQTGHQLAPAAMLLAAGATASVLRKTSEWTAIQALGGSRSTLAVPVLACALTSAAVMVAFDELVVTRSGERIDHMMLHVFGRWGDYTLHYSPKPWYRVGDAIVRVGGRDEAGRLTDVSLYEMDERFSLAARTDAAVMEPAGGERWRLRAYTRRTFLSGGGLQKERGDAVEVALSGSDPLSFAIRRGRPELMPTAALLEQQSLRARVGLPSQPFLLALHNRFAYPFTGVAAALFALTLALRRGRKGYLTQALFEGLVVSVVLFTVTLVARGLVMGEHLPAWVAAWSPVAVLTALAATLWRLEERPPRWLRPPGPPADRAPA
ncbi:MAG: LptF/LptG family permease [Myxococcaceae bacterium]|nr:LptF/LptG family permease [Myxococcaceae bacterium]